MNEFVLIAVDLNPLLGSECGVAASWLTSIADRYKVTIYIDAKHSEIINEHSKYNNATYVFIEIHPCYRWLAKYKLFFPLFHYFFYKVKQDLLRKRSNTQFRFIHCLTPAGIYAFNSLYDLGLPVIIGPIGGGLKLPKGFSCLRTPREVLREAFYYAHRFIPQWRSYFCNASLILVGTDGLGSMLPKACRGKILPFFDTLVDTTYFCPGKKTKSLATRVLFVGRLEPHKGILFAYEAFKILLSWGLQAQLDIAGDGNLRCELHEKVKQDNLSHCVNIYGNIPKSQVLSLMQQVDIFCYPTLREPGGSSILEAMSCGLPVVTTDYGGPSISVCGLCGIKVTPNSPADFIFKIAESLRRLIEDDALRHTMGYRAREHVMAHYSTTVLKGKIDEVYSNFLDCV